MCYLGGGFPGTVYVTSKEGWMESDVLRIIFKHTLTPVQSKTHSNIKIYDWMLNW